MKWEKISVREGRGKRERKSEKEAHLRLLRLRLRKADGTSQPSALVSVESKGKILLVGDAR